MNNLNVKTGDTVVVISGTDKGKTGTIQKAFPKEMGISLSAYIEKKRMELANELLLLGEDSVSEVAKKCGFTNDNTFYKAYRRTFGHAPTSLKQG